MEIWAGKAALYGVWWVFLGEYELVPEDGEVLGL